MIVPNPISLALTDLGEQPATLRAVRGRLSRRLPLNELQSIEVTDDVLRQQEHLGKGRRDRQKEVNM